MNEKKVNTEEQEMKRLVDKNDWKVNFTMY